MKKSLTVVALSVLLIGGGLLGSCGNGESVAASSTAPSSTASSVAATPTALTMWMSKADSAAKDDLVAGFNAKYPDTPISVTVTQVEEGDVGTKYLADPDATPDIAHVPGDVVNNLQSHSAIAGFTDTDVSSYINGDISTSTLKTATYSSILYGLPFSTNTFYLYYNTSFFTANDVKTLKGMNDAVIANNAKENATIVKKTLAFDMSNGWYIQSLFMSEDDGIYADDGTSETATNIATDKTLAMNVAKLVRDMYKSSSAPTATAPGYELGGDTDMKVALIKGETKAFVSGSWNYSMAKAAFGDDNVGMTCLPTIKLGTTDTAWKSVGDYKSIVVSNTSKNKKLAQKFAFYLASKEGQKIRFDDNGGGTMPTSIALNNDATFQAKNPFANVMGAVSENGVFRQNTCKKFSKNWWDASTAFAKTIRYGAADSEGNYDETADNTSNVTDTVLAGYVDKLHTALLA